MNDIQLIRDCLNGDTNSFGPIVRKYEALLLRTAFRYLGNWDDAQDATQDAFVKAYNALESYDQSRTLAVWLHRILVNTCLDRCRAQTLRLRKREHHIYPEGSSQNTLDRIAEKEIIQKALARLSIKRRQAFTLIDLEGYSSSEAAYVMGCSESTARVTAMKAREKLKKIYMELTAHDR